MATQHSATIRITNDTDSDANIELWHKHGLNGTVEKATWHAQAGETVGDLEVHFGVADGTGDWWYVEIEILNGEHAGTYHNTGHTPPTNSPYHECKMRRIDADKTHTFTVSTETFRMNLSSPSCSDTMHYAGNLPIRNIFVLMLENHSFDHLLGFSGLPGVNGLSGNESNCYTDPKTGKTYTCQVSKGAKDPMPSDPGHEFLDTLEQLCGPGTANPFPKGPYPPIDNTGFVANYATSNTESSKQEPSPPPLDDICDLMHCANSAEEVPALYQLARDFAVCDHWFASMPGPTWPNRFFAMGASSGGLDDSPSSKQIRKWELKMKTPGFCYPRGSIFDLMRHRDHRYRLYIDRSGPHLLGTFPVAGALKHLSLLNFHSFSRLATDLQDPYPYPFTFIEPNYGDIYANTYKGGSSQHPTDTLAAGDNLIAQTYNAIRNSPVWKNSLLIIAYDEHGGFYDHVSPPGNAPPPNDGSGDTWNTCGFNFEQYGVRVPAVVVSPLIKKGTVDNTLYDHAAIPKVVEELLGLPALTDRDAAAASLLDLLSLEQPRDDCPERLPATEIVDRPDISFLADGPSEDDDEPLPETGNCIGFLHIALKTNLELTQVDGDQHRAMVEEVLNLKTKGEARAYMRQVANKVSGYRAAMRMLAER